MCGIILSGVGHQRVVLCELARRVASQTTELAQDNTNAGRRLALLGRVRFNHLLQNKEMRIRWRTLTGCL